jgi:NodT family efflux transporter outer membrane factor (OMF) lipoprotein
MGSLRAEMRVPRRQAAAQRHRLAASAAHAWRHLRCPFVLAGALLSTACSFIPAYERPAAPVAAQFPQTLAEAGKPASEIGWGEFLADARLRALVELALSNNRDLRIATLNALQARALLGVQRADQLPTVNAGAAATRISSSGGNITAYTLGLAVSAFEIDLFGRVRSLGEAALARYLASDEGRRAAQVTLVAAVANSELALRADDELLQLTQRTLAAREEAQKLVRLRFDGGVIAEPELRSADSLVAGARANVLALQRQRSQDLNALELLLGQPLPATLPAAEAWSALRLAEVPAGLPSEVLLQRPDVRQAEQLLIASNANIGAARAAFFPRISLTGTLGFSSRQLSDLLSSFSLGLSPQLLQPIFDAGRNQANLDATRAGREIAVAQYEKSVQTAFREVADALAGRATLGEQLAAQQAQADAERRRLELTDRLYRGGVASQLDHLDAERSALAAQQTVVQLQLARLQNAVQLYRVLGGGAPAPAQ